MAQHRAIGLSHRQRWLRGIDFDGGVAHQHRLLNPNPLTAFARLAVGNSSQILAHHTAHAAQYCLAVVEWNAADEVQQVVLR